MTVEETEPDDSRRAAEDRIVRQQELYDRLPEPDLEQYPYPELDDLERVSVAE